MRYLTLLSTVVAATAMGLAFRNGMYAPATASSANSRASDFALGLSATRPDVPRPPAPRPVAKKEQADLLSCALEQKAGDGTDLLLARIANESGTFLLSKAAGDARRLRQAAAHFRACLAHEPTAGAGTLFADARRNLEQAERLLAAANRPAPAPVAPAAPERKAAAVSPPPAPAAAVRPEPVMVGPDGVIYRRAEEPR
jgi:hypothetical protein